MKTIFLSFSPKYYEYIISGKKIYEHRKRFCTEEVKAYLYLGYPVRKIVAILHLGKRINLDDWLIEYSYDMRAVARINDFKNRNNYAMPILSYQEIEPIEIDKLLIEFKEFHIPRSYFYLDKKPEVLQYLIKNTVERKSKVYNSFVGITADCICRY